MSKIDRAREGRSLPDGTHIIDTLTAASACRLTPPGFKLAAKKARLKRYAARGNRGATSYYWETGAVEVMAAERFRNSLTIVADEVVEAPYDDEKA